MSEQITKEKYMADKRADINNYENLLKAVLALKKYFEEEKNAQFYFGGHLINSQKKENPNYKGDTPDIIVETSSKSLLGEAKKSLPDPSTFVSKEQYIKSVIENKIMAQLKKYDADFENLKIKDHDVFLLVPEHNNDALGILKFDYLDKDKHFQNKFLFPEKQQGIHSLFEKFKELMKYLRKDLGVALSLKMLEHKHGESGKRVRGWS